MKNRNRKKSPFRNINAQRRSSTISIDNSEVKIPKYIPCAVMSIHGWCSLGRWQVKLAEVLNTKGLQSIPYNYGFRTIDASPIHVNRITRKFKDWYFSKVKHRDYDIDLNDPLKRPSIMAHSLGTWIIAKAIQKYPEIKFDKIFLFGSIIPSDFDWLKLILNDQVNKVINEKTKSDFVVPWSFVFTGSFKPSSRKGFKVISKFVESVNYSRFGHSDFQYSEHFSNHVESRLFQTPHQLKVVRSSYLKDLEAKNYLEKALKIDSEVYDNVYNEIPITLNLALKWYETENDIWTFLVHASNGEVIGYINSIPVNDDTYVQFTKGELNEFDLQDHHIIPYSSCQDYNLLILSIALKKNEDEGSTIVRGNRAELLLSSVFSRVEDYKQNCKLKKIAAIGWSTQGRILCEGFGMKKIGEDKHKHGIYELDVSEIDNINGSKLNTLARWWIPKLKKC